MHSNWHVSLHLPPPPKPPQGSVRTEQHPNILFTPGPGTAKVFDFRGCSAITAVQKEIYTVTAEIQCKSWRRKVNFSKIGEKKIGKSFSSGTETERIKLKRWCGTVRPRQQNPEQWNKTNRWDQRGGEWEGSKTQRQRKNSNGTFCFGGLVRNQHRVEDKIWALAAPQRFTPRATQLPWLPWRDTPPCRRWWWATRPRSPLWERWWPRATGRCPFYQSLRWFSCRRGNAADMNWCRNWCISPLFSTKALLIPSALLPTWNWC